ncbi:MAG: hypothetical protein BA866_02295 [Desulfobulbaceae bacterium S5133MH15]|nr:MAG: hypothetical protein BA866_02295 [Desulfobulbaceae bacterium S5133MH15]
MVTPVDENQIHRHSTSDQVTNDNNKASSFELISLAKLSTKILFTLLVLVLATLTFLVYLNDQEAQKKLIAFVDTTVSERGGALDAEIYSIVEYIKRMKSITDRHLLRSPDSEMVQTSIKRIEEAAVYHEKGDHSHLVKGTTIGSNEVLGSIIVSGKFNDQLWSRLKWILLGLDLFDSQEAEHSNSKNITLSYFGSKRDRFISIYPAIDMEEILSGQERNTANWFDHAFEVYDEFISRNNKPKREVFWTQPYLDRAGNGMMVSCAIAVDEPSGVAGILGADIILNFIGRFTVPIATLPGEMILVSPNREVISASGLSYDTESDIALLDAFLKSKNDELMDFSKQPATSNRQDEILFTYALKNAPWTLLYLVPKASVNARMFAARVRVSLILLMVMLVFGGGYSYLSKRFIQPGIKAITERNTVEQALRKSEERLELAMTVANDGLWDWHLKDDNVFFDSRYYTMAGYAPNEFPSQLEQWQQRVHPDDLQHALSVSKQHLTGKRDAYAVEFRFRRKQGDYMWILARGKIVSRDAAGKPLRFVGTHSDITQRKLAEEQLRILMRAVEQSHSTIVITDLDANIEFANPAFTRVTGYTLEEAVHRNPRILKSDEHDSAFYKSMWDTLYRGDVWQGEMRNKRKDGSLYWEFATISPVKNELGNTTHYVAIKEDITDRKEAAKQLEKAVTVAKVMSQEAETANRAKSAFLANMAHELRTPLNVILGFSRLLERGPSVTADQLEKLELIHRSGDHLLALINDILDISKIESGRAVVKLDNFDLFTFLKSIAMMFEQRAAEKLLHFSFEKDADIPQFIRTDKGKLRQILFNLLSNAIAYTKHGHVTLQVSTIDNVSAGNSVPEKQPVSEEPDLWLRFTIRDTGIGIASSDIDQIFKQFVQAENGASDKGGTGLGLSISQSFATIMGSFIQATSDKGKGSTFWFDLPVKVVYAADIKKATVSNRPIALAEDQPVYRILVVEDHKESRLMMTQLLKMVGFEVQEAVNGKKGVELFLQFQPNLILMDINMPVMDGLVATGKIRDTKAGADIPIIALTAHAFEKEREDILAAGCDNCIAKPYDENTLFATLSHHLGAQFDYGEEQDLVGHLRSPSPREPDLEALVGLPKALLTELATAAAELNQQRAMDCIAQIRIKDSSLADALGTLAERFMFEQLINHIGKIKNA